MLTDTTKPSPSQMKMDNNSTTKTDSKKTTDTPGGTGFAKTAVVYDPEGTSKQVDISDLKFNKGDRVYFAGNGVVIGQDDSRDNAMKQLVKIAQEGKTGKTDAITKVNERLEKGKKFKVFSNNQPNQNGRSTQRSGNQR